MLYIFVMYLAIPIKKKSLVSFYSVFSSSLATFLQVH
jgi:hypothetical protein